MATFKSSILLLIKLFALGAWANHAETIVSTFDTLPSNPVAVTDADLITDPYDHLKFNGFFARANSLSVLRSHSGENTASSSTLDRQLAGAPPPNITSKYMDSHTKYLTLLSTYIGCAITSEASTGVPKPCTLLFKGTTVGKKSPEQTCSYSGTVVNPAMQLCYFANGLSGVSGKEEDRLTFVSVEVDRSLTTDTTTVLYLDDLKHVNYLDY